MQLIPWVYNQHNLSEDFVKRNLTYIYNFMMTDRDFESGTGVYAKGSGISGVDNSNQSDARYVLEFIVDCRKQDEPTSGLRGDNSI